MGGSSSQKLPPPPPSLTGAGGSGQGQAVDDEITYFQAIPWCAHHLNNPSSFPSSSSSSFPPSSLIITPVWSRQKQPPLSPLPPTCTPTATSPDSSANENENDEQQFDDALFSTTLRTRDTIPAFVCFYPGPDEDRRAYLPRLRALVGLGALVAGYGGLSHGGVVAAVLDETLSLLAPAARWGAWKKSNRGRGGGGGSGGSSGSQGSEQGLASVMTAYLNVRYHRPVRVPAAYLVTARLVRRDGRKVFVAGEMEDGGGAVVASAEALFVEAREKL